MKKLILSLSLVLILVLATVGCAVTEEQSNPGIDQAGEEPPAAGVVEPPTSEESEESAQAPSPGEEEVLPPTGMINVDHISNLLDFEVWNRNNQQIADVNAIVINEDTSEIEYVVIATGGFLGLGETEIPVPWSVIQINSAAMDAENSVQSEELQAAETPQNVFILEVTEEDLGQMPEFDLTPLYEPEESGVGTETMTLEQLEQEIHTFWQSDMVQSGPKKLALADDLLGAPVQDPTQAKATQNFGRVEEITVDLEAGKLNYLLVSLNLAPVPVEGPEEAQAPVGGGEQPSLGLVEDPAAAGIEEPQLVAIPQQAVEWNIEEQLLIYTGSQSLEQAPTMTLSEFQSGEIDWQSEADSFWGVEGGKDVENQAKEEGAESQNEEGENYEGDGTITINQ